MLPVPDQQSPVTFVTQARTPNDASINPRCKEYAQVFLKLGWIQIVLSILSLSFGIAMLVYAIVFGYEYGYYYDYYQDTYAFIGTGIWCSVFFFTSGILGIYQAKQKTTRLLTAALTMTIFSAIFAATMFGIEVAAAEWSSSFLSDYYFHYTQEEWEVSVGLHATMSCIAFGALVSSIVHFAYCCHVHTCCNKSQSTAPGNITCAYVNHPQMTVTPSGQAYSFVPGHPITAGYYNSGHMMNQPVLITTVTPQQPIIGAYQVPINTPNPYPQQILPQQAVITAQPTPPPNYQQENASSCAPEQTQHHPSVVSQSPPTTQ